MCASAGLPAARSPETRQTIPFPRFRRQAKHQCIHIVSHPQRVLRAMAGDILLDFGSCRGMPFASRPRASASRQCTLQHQTAGGGRIGHIAASRLLQHGDERRRHRLVVSQQGVDGNGPGLAVALQDAGIQPELAAESGIKTRGLMPKARSDRPRSPRHSLARERGVAPFQWPVPHQTGEDVPSTP